VSRLVGLDVLLHYVKALRFLTVVLDNDTGAAHNLPCLALRVNLAKPSPLAKSFGARHGNQMNIVLRAQCLHQFDIIRLVTVLSKHAELSSMLLNGFGSLTKALHKTIMSTGLFMTSCRAVIKSIGSPRTGVGASTATGVS